MKRRLILLAAIAICLTRPAAATLWQTDPDIAALGNIQDVVEIDGRPVLCGRAWTHAGDLLFFVFGREADGTYTRFLPQDQATIIPPSVLHLRNGELVAGGNFYLHDYRHDVDMMGVISWNGERWKPLGGEAVIWTGAQFGLAPETRCFADDGDRLYIGGHFGSVDGIAEARNVVLWENGGYHALGNGLPRVVNALFVHDGVLYAGGAGVPNDFDSATLWSFENGAWSTAAIYADVPAVNAIAAWDGALVIGGVSFFDDDAPLKIRDPSGNWVPFTDWRSPAALITDLEASGDDLLVAGSWNRSTGMDVRNVARYDGTQWRGFSIPFQPSAGIVESLHVADERLWMAGDFYYGERIGLALVIEMGLPADLTARQVTDSSGTEWRFAWTGGFAGDAGSRSVRVEDGPEVSLFQETDPGVTVAVTPLAPGEFRHEFTVAGVDCLEDRTLDYRVSYEHFTCPSRSDYASWQTGSCERPNSPALSLAVAPNPFNPATTLGVELAEGGPVVLSLHDVRGRCVRTLIDGHREAGRHAFAWDGRDQRGLAVAAGVYYARLEAAGTSRVQSLVLIK